jgi:hypothetical protein
LISGTFIPADEADDVALGHRPCQRADQVGTLLLVENQRHAIRQVGRFAVHNAEVGLWKARGDLRQRVFHQKADREDHIKTLPRECRQVAHIVGGGTRFEVAHLRAEFLLCPL